MPIKLNGATSGSVELDVPAAVGSDLQLTLPTTAGEFAVKDTSGNLDVTSINSLNYPTAGPLSNRNLITNGAMQVAQRGTSHTGTGYGSLDRYINDSDQGAWDFSQENLSSGDPYNLGFRNFARLTNINTTNASGRRRKVYQKIEAQNIAKSGWNYTSSSSYVTLSFWVRTNVAGTYYFQVQTEDQTPHKQYSFSESLSVDVWTKVEKTIPGNSSLVINNDTGPGFRVIFNIDHGTDFTGSLTLNQWSDFSNVVRSPDTSTNWSNTLSATFDVTGVQLEVGSKATPFEHRSYGDELQRCMRYYYKSRTGGTYPSAYLGLGMTSNRVYAGVRFPVTMRQNPSVTIARPSDNLSNAMHQFIAVSGSSVAATDVSFVTCSPTDIGVDGFPYITTSGNLVSVGYLFHIEASAEL